jgi:hypothetical protein
LNIVIAPRFVISSALHSKISLPPSLPVLSHKPSQALVAVVVALAVVVVVQAVVAVALVVALAAIALAVVVEAVMALALALSLALVVAVLVETAVVVKAVLAIPVLHALPTHALHALRIRVLQVHALLNQSPAVNVATLAVAKYDSP